MLRLKTIDISKEDLIYAKIDFVELMRDIMKDNLSNKNMDSVNEFYESFRFYTVNGEDRVNSDKYKIKLPDRMAYPEAVCTILQQKKIVRLHIQ